MSEVTYEKVDELVGKRLKPVIEGIEKLSDQNIDALKELGEINGSVKNHKKEIKKLRKDLDEELEAAKKCPIRNEMVDVVVIEKETRWSRWVGKNRSFILVVIMIIALLSGFPNWMRFLGVNAPWVEDDPEPIIYLHEQPPP